MILPYQKSLCTTCTNLDCKIMKILYKLVIIFVGFYAGLIFAITSGNSMSEFTAYPLGQGDTVIPKVMLTMTKDHQLHYEAYNDYIDLIGRNNAGEYDPAAPLDFIPESTYVHVFDYYGYFNNNVCYSHGTEQRFVPIALENISGYCDLGLGAWHGNFLNWLSMTRMDVMRKVLYGGKRVTDTATETTLERAHLPPDAHSYAKFYDAPDLPGLTPFRPGVNYNPGTNSTDAAIRQLEGITFCNLTADLSTSDSTVVSQTSTAPPIIRVARGNYSLWATGERRQCYWQEDLPDTFFTGFNYNDPDRSGIYAARSAPDGPGSANSKAIGKGDYIVRVNVCQGLDTRTDCRTYGASSKPIGLLQEFIGRIDYGLLTGTYAKNISGGVLRVNPRDFATEINPADGTFVNTPGIVKNIDAIRVVGYRYDESTYRGNKGDRCDFQRTQITEGECRSWGNPLSEMFLETIRYFSGASSPTAKYNVDDTGFMPGMSVESWVAPVTEDTACASLNAVVINASVTSYDIDDLSGFNDIKTDALRGQSTLDAIVDLVGTDEGINQKKAFFGVSGGQADELCTPKDVPNLSQVSGICPGGPAVEGGYHIAGLAYYANTTDINPNITGKQTVTTYAVAMTPNVPRIKIDVDQNNTADVTLLPAYQLQNPNRGTGSGTLVEFKVLNQTSTSGRYFVSWDDSEQGGDHDQDVYGYIEYEVFNNAGQYQVAVTTDVIGQTTFWGQGFGYIISGTTQDGYHAHSGVNNYKYDDPYPGLNDCLNGSNEGCSDIFSRNRFNNPRTNTYTVGAGPAVLPPLPLFLAAKYGGFEDIDTNTLPANQRIDQQSEWDNVINSNGEKGSDGVPDNYFFVTDPSKFETRLKTVFNNIFNKIGSGSAPAVVGNGSRGVGATYQALFRPSIEGVNGDPVTWTGDVNAFWIDSQGFIREDTNANAVLDDYATDRVMVFQQRTSDEQFVTGASNQGTMVKLYRAPSGDALNFETFDENVGGVEFEYGALQPIWNATDWLSNISDSEIVQQRPYSSVTNRRHIITWLDGNSAANQPDGEVQASEVVDFTQGSFDSLNAGWLDLTDANNGISGPEVNEARQLVNYIRGLESPDYRARTAEILINTVDAERVLRLGDIVNSSPAVVSAPPAAYDRLYGDTSYRDFRKYWRNRRHVVYVGSNSGMLHAFNSGFYSIRDEAYLTNGVNNPPGGRTELQHPLGAELWAYVPGNLLPQLRFLSDPTYSHVFYMDASPKVFDAKIFDANDPDHPGGWGTVLVAGMRLGGGAITIDTQGNGLGNADDVTVGSAYIVLDITNPEKPPEVLAEINRGNRRTLSRPTAVSFDDFGGTDNSQWFLVFTDGPDEIGNVTSTQPAQLVTVDLTKLADSGDIDIKTIDLGHRQAFGGEITSVDWDNDYKADSLYVGTSRVNIDNAGVKTQEGRFIRIDTNDDTNPGNWSVQTLINNDQSFLVGAVPARDTFNNEFVMTGTGRLLTPNDKVFTNQNTLYGIIDRVSGQTQRIDSLSVNGLLDVTNARVEISNGETRITNVNGVIPDDNNDDQTEAIEAVLNAGGWQKDLLGPVSAPVPSDAPSEGQVVSSILSQGVLFVPATRSNENLCRAPRSRLIGLDYRTGTASEVTAGLLGTTGFVNRILEEDYGDIVGIISSPGINIDASGNTRFYVGDDSGNILILEGGKRTDAYNSWQELIN